MSAKPCLLFMSSLDDPDRWKLAFQLAWPELEVRVWPNVGNPDDVDFALVWKPEPGFLGSFRNLRLVINLGAGVDAISSDSAPPAHVPIVRLFDEGQAQMMSGFVLLFVLQYHREIYRFVLAKKKHQWAYVQPRRNADTRVGVMGLGYLGAHVANVLTEQGFRVSGWSRSRKILPHVETFAGHDELPSFLATLDILIAMLPATSSTYHILDSKVFFGLPRGAKFINVGRGSTVDEHALYSALVSGQIAAAALDVFEIEPLPNDHPFWEMEQVMITPHVASIATPETAVWQVVANCQRSLSNEPLESVVVPEFRY